MPHVCIDCSWHNVHAVPDPIPNDYRCPHWTPEYWQKQGYRRDWGDAAVMGDLFEILRKEQSGEVNYVILAPDRLRRPVHIYALLERGTRGESASWGSY